MQLQHYHDYDNDNTVYNNVLSIEHHSNNNGSHDDDDDDNISDSNNDKCCSLF